METILVYMSAIDITLRVCGNLTSNNLVVLRSNRGISQKVSKSFVHVCYDS